jgi:nitrite reductase/ring-hydroxylating ferredoxin subunit
MKEEDEMSDFVTVGKAADLQVGEMRAFDVRDQTVTVANVGGTLYAFSDVCTHQQCSLAEGELEEAKVICPCHGSEFDTRSGAVLQGPAQVPVRSYRVRVEGDALQIEV